MTTTKKNAGFDPSRDMPLAKPLLVHLDDATGGDMSGPGEGVSSFAICVKSWRGDDGAAGPPRISIQGVGVSKGSPNAQPRWTVQPDGSLALTAHPPAGALCLYGAIGRESPAVSAALYGKVAAYAAKVAAALARKGQKAA